MATTKDFRCAVRADLFARASAAISREETRYYLNGVFVQPCDQGGAIMVSTDGHWLVCVHDPRGICEGSGIVKLDKKMIQALKSGRQDWFQATHGHASERVLVVEAAENIKDSKAMVVLGGRVGAIKEMPEHDPRGEVFAELQSPSRNVVQAQFFDTLIDGQFPDWRRVVPDEADFTARAPDIDQRLVDLASKALAPAGDNRRPVKLGPKKGVPMGPVTVILANKGAHDFSAFAVVMPIRTDEKPSIPTFHKKKEPNQ